MTLCDIGNSFYHFYIDGEVKKFPVDKLPKLKSKKIYFISVNRRAKRRLESRYKLIDLAKRVKFKSRYSKSLGVDRVFAMLPIKSGVVVDAGSAITIDILKNSKHLGGVILAGVSAQKRCYSEISKKLNIELNLDIDLKKLPLNTTDAITYAILKSTILTIESLSKGRKIYFTGGDGEFLSKFFKNSIYDRDLIFKGMLKVLERKF